MHNNHSNNAALVCCGINIRFFSTERYFVITKFNFSVQISHNRNSTEGCLLCPAACNAQQDIHGDKNLVQFRVRVQRNCKV